MDAELAEIAGDPLAPELFGDGGGGAGAAEEIGDEIAFVRAGFDDALEKGFGLLGGVFQVFQRNCLHFAQITPKVLHGNSRRFVQIHLEANGSIF